MSKIDIHHLTKKQRKQMHGWLRAIIQLLYFMFLPSAYTAAFAGVKYIFTQLGAGEKIGLTSFVSVLIVLCLYTIVFGRFFCGFACAFGSFGDSLCLCVDLQKNQEKAGETAGNSDFKTLNDEIRCTGCDSTSLLQRCVQSDTGLQSMGCFLHAACL